MPSLHTLLAELQHQYSLYQQALSTDQEFEVLKSIRDTIKELESQIDKLQLEHFTTGTSKP